MQRNTIALFAGSFDPFTLGHYDIVCRALQLFDRVVIAIGNNDKKHTLFSLEQRITMLQNFFSSNDRVEVCSYSGLTVDFARQIKASVLVRGIRSAADYEYERTLADVNQHLMGIDTVLLFTSQALSHISSSIVRELLHYGHDVTNMLPPGIVLPSM